MIREQVVDRSRVAVVAFQEGGAAITMTNGVTHVVTKTGGCVAQRAMFRFKEVEVVAVGDEQGWVYKIVRVVRPAEQEQEHG